TTTRSGRCSTASGRNASGVSAQTNRTSVRWSTESSISRKEEHSFPRRIVVTTTPRPDAPRPSPIGTTENYHQRSSGTIANPGGPARQRGGGGKPPRPGWSRYETGGGNRWDVSIDAGRDRREDRVPAFPILNGDARALLRVRARSGAGFDTTLALRRRRRS